MSRRSRAHVIDLFAGAGGLSVGATQAGAHVAACLEFNRIACDTLRGNPEYHGTVVEGDIRDYSGEDLRRLSGLTSRSKLIVVGGPPCQPFSKAAYWTEDGADAAYRRARAEGREGIEKPAAPTIARDDDRRDLVKEFWRIVVESRADGFVFENVPSIRHPRNRPVYNNLLQSARQAGFEVTEIAANAAEFGVAQTRERVLILGSKRRAPRAPEPTHCLDGSSLFTPAAVTAGEALEEFSAPSFHEPEEVVTGRWAKHLQEVPPGWNYKAHTAWANHPNPTFVTETRFWNFLLKLSQDRPSWTLAASPGPWTGPFHWSSRRLRTPEMAALQGFPRGYFIAGPRRERVRQMGNAVPVPLARAAVSAVLDTL